MCLAVPMKVIELTGDPDDIASDRTAVVATDGIQKKVRLDIVDRWPGIGEYVIIHAGFAIHTLAAEEGENNLKLIQAMAEGLDLLPGSQ